MATNNTKRILIFSTAYYPFLGGAEVAVKEITDRLSNDFEFDLVTAKLHQDLPRVEKIGAITVYRVGFGKMTIDKLLLPFLGLIQAWRLQNRRKYFCLWAVMVSYSSGAGYLFNIVRALSGQTRIPIILNLQEGDSEDHLKYRWGGLIALSWKLAMRQTDFLTALSNFLLNRAKKNGYTGPSLLVPNGADIEVFSRKINSSVKEKLKEEFGKKADDVFLVTVSRLVRKNATDDIISALPHLAKNVSLIVIGNGVESFRLQKQAHDLGVESRVKFLGFVSHEDIPKYLSICDIFIRPSRSEGFGNSFIEAMASGLPVIATPVGGIPDFLDDKITGVFCSPDNPHSIVQSVKLILDDNVLRRNIIRGAYHRVTERYTWSNIAQKMKDVFDRF